MTKPRPCGCKGCRTCLICETQYGADNFKLQLDFDKSKGYVYCPFCNKAWRGWDMDLYKQHPYHEGDSIDYPGVYIQLDFISENEEKDLMNNIDEMPWDISQSTAEYNEMKVYSGAIFAARFLFNDRCLITAGGTDAGLMLWDLVDD